MSLKNVLIVVKDILISDKSNGGYPLCGVLR